MRRVLAMSFSALALFLTAGMGAASGDPINSHIPGDQTPGTFVCGDITYTNVSPPGREPAGQLVTANGSNSTSVQIMILDKAAKFPQDMLTQCTFIGPEGFTDYFLITPVG